MLVFIKDLYSHFLKLLFSPNFFGTIIGNNIRLVTPVFYRQLLWYSQETSFPTIVLVK